MSKPTSILDKSVVHPIAALEEGTRTSLWNELYSRYQILVPWVLIEEVWTNYLQPGQKNPGVVNVMVDQLKALHPCWVDEKLNLVYQELVVLKKTPKHFQPPVPKFIDWLMTVNTQDPELQQFLEERKQWKEEDLNNRITAQKELESELIAHGKSTRVASESEFFQTVIKGRVNDLLDNQHNRFQLLFQLFGRTLSHRHPNQRKQIKKAIKGFNRETFTRYCITLGCVLAKLFYIYAPVYRIDDGTKDGRAIIGRGRSDQRNNIFDEDYVSAALMCEVLITRDEDMARMMNCFIRSGLWKGKLIFLSPPASWDALFGLPNQLRTRPEPMFKLG